MATLAKDHPFTFLDHAIKHGDSLVGLTRDQIESFHWLPNKPPQPGFNSFRIREKLIEAQIRRDNIRTASEAATEPELTALLRRADEATDDVRLLGDLAVLAFFDRDKAVKREQLRKELYDQAGRWITGERPRDELGFLQRQLSAGPHPVHPFHWEVEFHEVFNRQNPGFNAIVGNPPFMGGTVISTANGMGYFEWLRAEYPPAGHLCDLVAYFFRRAFDNLRVGGTFGLLATNTVSQGDIREGGLSTIMADGGSIYAARRRYRWPGQAAVIVSVVNVAKEEAIALPTLDGLEVGRISAYLMEGTQDASPARLASAPYCSAGSKIYGQGFLFDDADEDANPRSELASLLRDYPTMASRVLPYIGGEEVNTSPTHAPRRDVIYLSDIENEEDLEPFSVLSEIVRRKVKPERDRLGSNPNNIPLRRRWWAYQAHRPELYSALRDFDRVLVNSQVSAHLAFALLSTEVVFAHTLNVYTLDSFAAFACLQCRVHEVWVRSFASSMKDDLRYTPSDCFETFPFPSTTARLYHRNRFVIAFSKVTYSLFINSW